MATSREILTAIYRKIDGSLRFDASAYNDAFSCIRNIGDEEDKIQVELAHELRRRMSKVSAEARSRGDHTFATRMFDLNRRAMCYTAPDCLDDFMLYMEMNRPYEKQFYLPRRKQLKRLVDALQRLEERKLKLLGISLPPGTGKSTTAEFFLSWTGGRHPELPILTGSHSNSFLRGMYDEINRLLDPQGEYLWHDVFPKLKVIKTNAQDMMIDLGEDKRDAKRFATFEFSSIGSGNAGKVRAGNLLYCDDLVDGLETALSRDRMDKLYNQYATDLRQRKLGDCVELHIATRWSVQDVIGRLENLYADDPEAEFIVCPALDDNDESLFDYPNGVGLSTRFLHEQRDAMDDASWRALYMNQPVEREGQLYPEEQLRRYFELPDGEPDAVISVCDTKDRGSDYCVMPIAYQYGQDFYIEDVVCDNSAPDVVEPRLISKCLEHKIYMSRFESNSAGGRIAEKVQSEVKAKGGRTKITTKYTTQNKETKIIMASPFIKEHFLFKDNSVMSKNKEYRMFLRFLCSYTMAGKNKHDDVPDALAMLADFVNSFTASKVEVISRPW